MYKILYQKSVEKDLRSLSSSNRKVIVSKIRALSDEPRPTGAKKIRGSDNTYRIRQADYRILYRIEDNALIILIVKVGHRREVYRDI